MSESARWKLRVLHILEHIKKIESYTGNMGYETLIQDDKTMDAVTRCIQIIGEAARCIPKDIQDSYPDIPWREVIAMRHIVVHDYHRVDPEILYKTITEDLPELKNHIQNIPISKEDL